MNCGSRVSAAFVLLAVAGSAFAQSQIDDSIPAGLALRKVEMRVPGSTAGQNEIPQTIFAIYQPGNIPAPGGAFGNGGSTIAFDIGQFDRTPAPTFPIAVDGVAFGYVNFTTLTGTFDTLITFFDGPNVNQTNSAAPFYANAFGAARINGIGYIGQVSSWFPTVFTLTAPINFPSNRFGYEQRILVAGSDPATLFPQGAGSGGLGVGPQPLITGNQETSTPVPAQVGFSEPSRWFDGNFNNAIDFTGAGQYGREGGLSQVQIDGGRRRNVYLLLRGDVPAPNTPSSTDLGTINCNVAPATVTATLTPGQVVWYSFILPADANQDVRSYLDIVTQSAGGALSSAIALYDATGALVTTNQPAQAFGNGAGGTFSVLTFGHGRRDVNSGDTTSILADGRFGPLAANATANPRYYLAVGGQGTAFGPSGFSVNGSAHSEAGALSVVFGSNVNATANCALPAPVAPRVAAANDLTTTGNLPAGPTLLTADPEFFDTVWFKFSTGFDTNDATNYLDIDTNQQAFPVTTFLSVWSNTGTLIAQDVSTVALSLISFGTGALPRPALNGLPAPSGQNGNLAPGTYFLAASLAPVALPAIGPSNPTNFGWQVVAASGSSLPFGVNFRTKPSCRGDYNGDAVVNTDDISDYITDYFTDPPVSGPGGYAIPCAGAPAPYDTLGYKADFNQDCVVNTDDISDFITEYFSACNP